MPIRLRLNVTVRAGSREDAGGATLPIERRLARHTPQMLAWAKRNAENSALLITNPAAAVGRAKLAMPSHARRELATAALRGGGVLPPGVQLVGLDVKLTDEPRQRPKPTPPRPTKPARAAKAKRSAVKAKPASKRGTVVKKPAVGGGKRGRRG